MDSFGLYSTRDHTRPQSAVPFWWLHLVVPLDTELQQVNAGVVSGQASMRHGPDLTLVTRMSWRKSRMWCFSAQSVG